MKFFKLFLASFLLFTISLPQVFSQSDSQTELGIPYNIDSNIYNITDKITNYDVDLTIREDRSVEVTENITINNGSVGSIQRGIFRDFPTLYKNKYGFKDVVDLKILEVLRDGHTENYVEESLSGGKRLRIGREEYFLPDGQYTYTIKYTMDKQIRSFEDTDELYFNLVGTGWDFEIDNITAEVRLPQKLNPEQTEVVGYSGKEGETGKDFVSYKTAKTITFASTRPYKPYEGLTVSVSFPKGYVTEKSNESSIFEILFENILAILALVLGLSSFIYYYFVWLMKGRDPYTGTIIPTYQPPSDLTPAQMRYMDRMGFDYKAITAAIVSMGVKGYLKIIEEDKQFKVEKLDDNIALEDEEKTFATNLFGVGAKAAVTSMKIKIFGLNLSTNIPSSITAPLDEIEFSPVNSYLIQKAVQGAKSSLEKKFDKKYIHHNFIYIVVGVLINLAIIGFVLLQNFIHGNIEAIGFIIFASFWNGIISIFIFGAMIPGWIEFAKSRQGGCSTLFLTVFLIPFISIGLFMLGAAALEAGIWPLVAIILPAPLHAIFYKALKARTNEGRELQNQIEGFKIFLNATEAEQLKFFNKELPHNFETFQKYLPYAIALDVETKWTERFNDVITDYTKTHDSPGWYSGSSIGFASSSFASSMSSTLSSSISSSTSSGSSGGSSGGGGGGGGGGGW